MVDTRDKSFNDPDKSKMVNCLLLLAAFIYWKILLWMESFTTCQVLNRTGDLRDSQISATSGGLEHITLEAPRPAPATSINYLLLMLKNVQFPSLLMRSSDAVLKFHDLESFAFWGGGYFFFAKVETWIHHFLPFWTKSCVPSGGQSSTFVQALYVRSQWMKQTQAASSDTQKCKWVKWKFK